jgi:hypothetical protein
MILIIQSVSPNLKTGCYSAQENVFRFKPAERAKEYSLGWSEANAERNPRFVMQVIQAREAGDRSPDVICLLRFSAARSAGWRNNERQPGVSLRCAPLHIY